MNSKEKVLEALQNFITEREVAQKKKIVNKNVNPSSENNLLVLDWTLTQLHIVAAIKKSGLTNNAMLSKELNLSKPAITKAVKKLLEYKVITINLVEGNKKEVHYILTEQGERLAFVHEQLHEKARQKYLYILKDYSDTELDIITKFLNTATETLKKS